MTADRPDSPVHAARPLVLACVGDLMLTTRIEAVAAALDYALRTAGSVAEVRTLAETLMPAAALLDLTAPGLPLTETLDALRGPDGQQPFVLGFFPHVQKDVGRTARAAGCTLVVPRSRFMAELPALLQRAVAGDGQTAAELAAIDTE